MRLSITGSGVCIIADGKPGVGTFIEVVVDVIDGRSWWSRLMVASFLFFKLTLYLQEVIIAIFCYGSGVGRYESLWMTKDFPLRKLVARIGQEWLLLSESTHLL